MLREQGPSDAGPRGLNGDAAGALGLGLDGRGPVSIVESVSFGKTVSVREGRVPSVRESLMSRAAEVAEELRAGLTPIVEECAGAGRRPAVLARTLSIDRTLAARVLRSIRARDSVQALHEIPAPGGLRIFLDAAVAAGVQSAQNGLAAKSVRRFEQLIDEFPGGRAALDAALGGFDESVRQRSSRAAAQAIHRSMTSLLGYQADVMLGSVIIQPSESGDLLDTVYLLGKLGVRRLRASSPITVFGWRGEQLKDAPHAHRVETIDGLSAPENGNAYLLTDFCSRPTPPVSLFHTDNLYLYTLAESVPPLNTPVNLISAHVVRNNGVRYSSEHTAFHWETHTPRFPCKVLLADVFVRDDVFPGRTPALTTRLHSIATGAARPDAPAFKLDNVEMAPPVVPLGMGLGGVASRDLPAYPDMLARAFTSLGWDPSRFRGYRCRMQYPIPLVSVTFWFDLPAAPATV